MYTRLLKYFCGESTVDERLELISRIETDSQLKSEFVRLRNLNAITQLTPHSFDRHEGAKSLQIFISRLKKEKRKKRITVIVRYAAVAAILIAATIIGTIYTTTKPTLNTLSTSAGQLEQITLHDGTKVWLNAYSTLTYPSRFSRKNRKVEITGEAFFDVAQEKRRPFIVSSQHIDMKVLGTQFNVYSYPEAGYIQTDLIEGSLKIYQRNNENSNIVLKPNEQIEIRRNNVKVGRISNPEHILWKTGIYSFHNERLMVILEKLQLYYDVEIVVEDPSIYDVRYTGKFRQSDGIDKILRIIQKIHSFKIEREPDSNIITLTLTQ